jgi:hypothetical protein
VPEYFTVTPGQVLNFISTSTSTGYVVLTEDDVMATLSISATSLRPIKHLMRLRLTARGLMITTFRFSRRCLMGRRREPVALIDRVAIRTSL